jgi:hypothetical protein
VAWPFQRLRQSPDVIWEKQLTTADFAVKWESGDEVLEKSPADTKVRGSFF